MAWCYYCRAYTVNGRCPNCNRMYQEPNKNYDFYGKEIKNKPQTSSNKSSSGFNRRTYVSSGSYYGASYKDEHGSFAAGFWLSLPISFIAIIIASKKQKPEMKKGAIVGTIIWGIVILHIVTILLAIFNININQQEDANSVVDLIKFF